MKFQEKDKLTIVDYKERESIIQKRASHGKEYQERDKLKKENFEKRESIIGKEIAWEGISRKEDIEKGEVLEQGIVEKVSRGVEFQSFKKRTN